MELEIKEHLTSLRKENLDSNQYTVALLKEGLLTGIISKQTIESIQTQIIFILKDLILRFTRGESTSVTVETAEKLLCSIYYTIDACLSLNNNPEDSIVLLKLKNIQEIYEQGVEIINACVRETKELYQDIQKRKLDIPLEAYNATLDEALPEFFRTYGIVFNAHDTMASIDYPLIFDDMKIKGVFYIKQYLEKLAIETEFCRFFSQEEMIKTLKNYGKIYQINYEVTLINIFEIIINNSIFSVLAGNDTNNLTIFRLQSELLNEKFRNLNTSAIPGLINEAIQKIINSFSIEQPELIQYIEQYQTILLPKILQSRQQGSLDYLIITGDEDNLQNGGLTFKNGTKMSDHSFRLIIKQIISCKHTSDKLKMIKSSIHSLEDYIDVLKADCLFRDEFQAVFSTLSDIELALLARTLFADELRSGPLNSSDMKNGKGIATEVEWERQYLRFIQGLSMKRVKSVARCLNELISDAQLPVDFSPSDIP